MNDGEARDIVNGAALVVGAMYFYRKLIEPASAEAAGSATGGAADGAAGESPPESPGLITTVFKGPTGSRVAGAAAGEPSTVGGAAGQLFGQGPLPSTERFVVGWGFVFLVLSLTIDASPELAAAFAMLVATGAVLGNGVQVSKDLHTQLSSKAPTSADTSSQGAAPTTTVDFAGQGATSSATALTPEGSTANRRKNTGKKRVFKVESA